MRLRLHPKYGVNPTISKCIICGEDTGEIALLGAAYSGEAPMHMVTGLEPCGKCRAKYMTAGVMLAEATDPKHPTGNLVVIKEEAFTHIFNQSIPKGRIALVDKEVFARIQETEQEEKP